MGLFKVVYLTDLVDASALEKQESTEVDYATPISIILGAYPKDPRYLHHRTLLHTPWVHLRHTVRGESNVVHRSVTYCG
jgi:hypothetical protein